MWGFNLAIAWPSAFTCCHLSGYGHKTLVNESGTFYTPGFVPTSTE